MSEEQASQIATKPCNHFDDESMFSSGKCLACGYECEHESEWLEPVDTEQVVEYWGAPTKIGSKWVVCTMCGQDITDLMERDY